MILYWVLTYRRRLTCSPGLPLIVASPPAKSAIDRRADMYHDGRRMGSERAR